MNKAYIEVVLSPRSTANKQDVIQICSNYLKDNYPLLESIIISKLPKNWSALGEDVQFISIELKTVNNEDQFEFRQLDNIVWHVYKLDAFGAQMDMLGDGDGDGDNDVHSATFWTLPSQDLFGVWENLVYDTDIKEKLVKYAEAMAVFSNRNVNANVLACNRVILLHGPPGSGKTSLCKALAQKLSVRMQSLYRKSVLVEINSHSLFSKWFSESGKLVSKMFKRIHDIVQEPDMLVCVLIDEIESLVHARSKAISGNEPSDAIRVVNAVLTQIDQIKRYPNVIVLTTSNVTEAIDLAFVDRADVKQYIGPPSSAAIAKIYRSCIEELIKTEIISADVNDLSTENVREKIASLSQASAALNGRTLRKIPVLAYADHLMGGDDNVEAIGVPLSKFLDGMALALEKEREDREYFASTVPNTTK